MSKARIQIKTFVLLCFFYIKRCKLWCCTLCAFNEEGWGKKWDRTGDRRKRVSEKEWSSLSFLPRKPGCFYRLLVLGFRWHRHVRFPGNFTLRRPIQLEMDDSDLVFLFYLFVFLWRVLRGFLLSLSDQP